MRFLILRGARAFGLPALLAACLITSACSANNSTDLGHSHFMGFGMDAPTKIESYGDFPVKGALPLLYPPHLASREDFEFAVESTYLGSTHINDCLVVRKKESAAPYRYIRCIEDLPLELRIPRSTKEADALFRLGENTEWGFHRFSRASVDSVVAGKPKAESGTVKVRFETLQAEEGLKRLLEEYPTTLVERESGGYASARLVLLLFNDKAHLFGILSQSVDAKGDYAVNVDIIHPNTARPIDLKLDILVGW